MRPRVQIGEGVLDRLPDLESVRGAASVAIFAGQRALRGGARPVERVERLLAPRRVVRLYGIPAEPSPSDLQSFEQAFLASDCEAIVAIGGGSVLDVAKGVAFSARAGSRPLRVIAVPTTAGTGSEVTPFATFWDRAANEKRSLDAPALVPDEAIVDPLLSHSMPPRLTACTGIDAFTQACEAYWNLHSDARSDTHALRAVALLVDALPKAVRNGSDRVARDHVMRGSLEAGLAFASTRTTACHGLSYGMTLRFGVSHGQAVAITLPEVLPLNVEAMTDGAGDAANARGRLGRFCDALGVARIDDAPARIRTLLRASGLATRLNELSIQRSAFERLAADAIRSNRMTNNPFPFTEASLATLLHRVS